MKRDGLPKRVYAKHGRYWYVSPDNKWHGLTRVKQGLPAMYRALASLTDAEATSDRMPAVITRWLTDKEADWAVGTAEDMDRVGARLSARFLEFAPRQITTPVCVDYLRPYLRKPRTYNLHRSVLRQVLAFAAREGLREGHNPIDNIPQRRQPKRIRIVTPAEIDAMAKALMTAARGGEAHVRMLGLALKTGQRIGDVLRFRAQDCTEAGLLVDQGKTGEKLVIEWDAELTALVDACFEGRDRVGYLLVQSTGAPYKYAGVRSAWVRAMAKAGIEDLHIHDLRGEAGARISDLVGSYAAQMLLGHASIKMTEAYVRGKTRRVAQGAPLKKVTKE